MKHEKKGRGGYFMMKNQKKKKIIKNFFNKTFSLGNIRGTESGRPLRQRKHLNKEWSTNT